MAEKRAKETRKKPKRQERAEPPTCSCNSRKTYYASPESLRRIDPVRFLRYAIDVGCDVQCEAKTSGQCLYNYGVHVKILARDIGADNQLTGDWHETTLKPAINRFTLTDPKVSFTLRNGQAQELMMRHSEYVDLAPQMGEAEVVVGILPSKDATEVLEWSKRVEICLPRLANPNCPEWI